MAGSGSGSYPLSSLKGDEQIIADRAGSAYLNYTTPNQIRDWDSTSVSVSQIKQALAAVSSATLYSVNNAVSADVASIANIIWTSGRTDLNDALYTLIQTTLGYTNNQMAALYAAALTFPQ